MRVIVSLFGNNNVAWNDCLRDSKILTIIDPAMFPYWEKKDRNGFIDYAIKFVKSSRGNTVPRSTASRWYNFSECASNTNGDLWLHREEDKLWWTITKNEDYYILNEPARPPHITGPFISINKASQKWSDRSKKGVPLRLSSLPSLVVRSITNQSTQISPDREVAEFIIALINDHDVSPWTSKPKWTSDAKQSKKNPVTHFSPEQIAAYRMASTAFETVKKADGRTIESTAKIKNIIDFTEEELRKHVEDLISDQEGICALTELPLQFDTDLDDPELSASLDRIDSNGHYEKGNLQIVCKFANRWKGADDNSGFLRLMGLIKP